MRYYRWKMFEAALWVASGVSALVCNKPIGAGWFAFLMFLMAGRMILEGIAETRQ